MIFFQIGWIVASVARSSGLAFDKPKRREGWQPRSIGPARMRGSEISRLLLNSEKRSYALLAKKLQFSRQVAGEIRYALGIEEQDKIILVNPID
jgi:uncharacterized alpha-E superfamily protein